MRQENAVRHVIGYRLRADLLHYAIKNLGGAGVPTVVESANLAPFGRVSKFMSFGPSLLPSDARHNCLLYDSHFENIL